MRARYTLLLSFLIALVTAAACEQHFTDSRLLEFSGLTMGTTYSIKLKQPDTDSSSLASGIQDILDEVNNRMSTYLDSSELSRLNRNGSSDWIRISDELHELLKLAAEVNRTTRGGFDVTIGPVVNLWGFGPDPVPDQIPDAGAIQSETAKIGMDKIILDPDKPRLKKSRPDLYLDLSGIAKGYAVDRVAEYLSRYTHDYLIEIGGEIRAAGTNAAGTPWRIGIEKPVTGSRAVQRIIGLTDMGMATSGDYRNFYMRDGIRYAHTIDPRTGRPVTHRLASVTVLHSSAAMADGLATGLLVLGPDHAYAVAEEKNLAAYFLTGDEEGFTEKFTPEFARYLVHQDNRR